MPHVKFDGEEHTFEEFQPGGVHADADESVFMARSLEWIESKTYQKKFPAYRARELFPVDNSGGPGVLTITYRMMEPVGIAQAISDYANDFARVSLRVREFIGKVKEYGNAIIYNQREVDAARYANVPLEGEYANAARKAYEARIELVASGGDPVNGLQGYNTNPNIPIIAAPTGGTSGSKLWSVKTADEIIADVSLLFSTMVSTTNDTHKGTVLLMSPDHAEIIQRLRLSNTGDSLLSYLQKTNPGLAIERWNPMKTAALDGGQRISLYERDPEVVTLREPMPFTIDPFQRDMRTWKAPTGGRTAGVVVRYPFACIHMDDC